MSAPSWIAILIALISASGTVFLAIRTERRFKENEREKRENSKQLFVHQLQFQKEFEIYQELWDVLIDLGIAIEKLRPMGDLRPLNKSDEEIDNERMNEARKQGQKAIDIMYKRKPFYAPNIYPYLDKLTTIILFEMIAVNHKEHAMKTKPMEYFDEGAKAMKEYKEISENICNAIRDRIYISPKNI